MEQYVIDLLDNSSIGLGTALGLILGALVIGASIWNFLGPIVENHDRKIKQKTEEENDQEKREQEIRQKLESIIDKFDQLNQSQEECQISIQQYDSKLDNVLKELSETKRGNTETREKLLSMIEHQNKEIQDLRESQKKMNDQIDILIESDKEDIKAYITKEYNYWMFEKHAIDPYTLASIEARFSSYKKEHGNTFVDDLVIELRNLPKIPSSIQHVESSSDNK